MVLLLTHITVNQDAYISAMYPLTRTFNISVPVRQTSPMVNSVFTLRSRNTCTDVPKSTLVSGNAPRRIIYTFDSTMENGFDTNSVNTVSRHSDRHKRIIYLTIAVRTLAPSYMQSF